MKHCPFCQEELLPKEKMYSSPSWRCPKGHYDFCPLGAPEEYTYQESIYFKDFSLIMNYPDFNQYFIKIYNKSKRKSFDEIKVNSLIYIRPFILSYDYKSLEKKLETLITFQ